MYNLRTILSASLLGVIIGLFPLVTEGQTKPAVYQDGKIPIVPVTETPKAEIPTISTTIEDKELPVNANSSNQEEQEKTVEESVYKNY